MRKLLKFLFVLMLGCFCCACVNTFAIHELNEKAYKYLENGDNLAAISRYEASVDLDGEVYESRYNLANALNLVGRCKDAVEHAKVATNLRPKEPIAYFTLGVVSSCAAEKSLFIEKGGVKKPIKIEELPNYSKIQKEFVDYLNISNNAYEQYLQLVPNSEDAQDVSNIININKGKIEKATKAPEKNKFSAYNYYGRY